MFLPCFSLEKMTEMVKDIIFLDTPFHKWNNVSIRVVKTISYILSQRTDKDGNKLPKEIAVNILLRVLDNSSTKIMLDRKPSY